MISSASSSDRTPRTADLAAGGGSGTRPAPRRADRVSTESAAFLRAELQRQPEIRSEVVARARRLAADPSYPSPAVLSRVASLFLASPDLSNDES